MSSHRSRSRHTRWEFKWYKCWIRFCECKCATGSFCCCLTWQFYSERTSSWPRLRKLREVRTRARWLRGLQEENQWHLFLVSNCQWQVHNWSFCDSTWLEVEDCPGLCQWQWPVGGFATEKRRRGRKCIYKLSIKGLCCGGKNPIMKVVRHCLPPSELVAFAKFIHNINTFYTLCGSDQCSCGMCRCPNYHISLHIELNGKGTPRKWLSISGN